MSKASLETVLLSIEDKIEELDDLILCLSDKSLRESTSSIITHFSEVSNELADLIMQLDEILTENSFSKEEVKLFNSYIVEIVGKCKVYDTDYSYAKKKNKTNEDVETSHKRFVENIQNLDKRIGEYNSKNKNKIYDFKKAVEIYNKKSTEIFFEDLRSEI